MPEHLRVIIIAYDEVDLKQRILRLTYIYLIVSNIDHSLSS